MLLGRIIAAWWSALCKVVRTAWRVPILNLGSVAAFGILIPRRYGMDFLDVRLILAYAFIPMLFVAPVVTAAMREGSEARQSSLNLYSALGAIITYGWLIGAVVMALSIATINYVYHPPELLLPDQGVLQAYAIFCLASVSAVAALGAYIALLFSPGVGLNVVRLGFFALLVFFYGGSGRLPVDWQIALAGAFSSDRFFQTALIVSAILILFAIGMLQALRPAVVSSKE